MDVKLIKKSWYVFLQNPRFFFKRAFWEVKFFLLSEKKSGILKKNDVTFPLDFSLGNKIKKMQAGNFQPIVTEILKQFLKKGDTFIDAGANIGYFSFIGSGLVGKKGQVHSFEPVPEYFLKLDAFAKINKGYQIKANQMALGDKEAILPIFIKGGEQIGNNTFFPELLGEGKSNIKEVSVVRLDDYIAREKVKNITLIKIDVEGFEFPVLLGLSRYFEQCESIGSFPAIICEVVPSAYEKQGHVLQDLFSYMEGFEYYPYDVFNTDKKINIKQLQRNNVTDVLFKHG